MPLAGWTHAPMTAEAVRERLEEKGFVSHSMRGRTYVFRPRHDRLRVAAKAVHRIAEWFCNGSIEEVVVVIVDAKMLGKEQLDAIAAKIETAKRARK
jgi:predicted transcriptional regulator